VILEFRTYTVLPDRLRAWLALWEASALPVQREIIGGFLGMYVTDIGVVNEVVHLWQFDSLAERERRRALLDADPRWAEYRREVERLAPITSMSSRIGRPTAFSPALGIVEP
jgi:hypothetical protein